MVGVVNPLVTAVTRGRNGYVPSVAVGDTGLLKSYTCRNRGVERQ